MLELKLDMAITVTISLPPEAEARLRNRAAALGTDVQTLVRQAVEQQLFIPNGNKAAAASDQRWSAEFAAWMNDVAGRSSLYPPGYAADDSRQSIYEGRDE